MWWGLFKCVCRSVASIVHVITASRAGLPAGMTATAVSAVCMEPPSILICVNESASAHELLAEAGHFGVNVLHRDQRDVASAFSDEKSRHVRFQTGDWQCGAEPTSPFLDGAQAVIICRQALKHKFGTHSIIIGVMEEVRIREAIDPPLYLDG
jgi:flavin reductase